MTELLRDGEQTLLVETYGPSAGAAPAVQVGVDLGAVRVLTVIAVPGDEVVFYLVSAPSAAEAKHALESIGVESVRIVPAVWAAGSKGA